MLIVALVAAMVVRSMDDASTATPARPTAQGRAPANTAQGPMPFPGAADVKLEALTRARGEPATAGRNPFRFQPKPPPPAPPVAQLPTEGTPQMPAVPTGPPPP